MNIHDYHLDGYSVNYGSSEIRMRLSWPYDQTKESKEIVFGDVTGYHFQDAIGSVISDLEEREIEDFLKAHEAELSTAYQTLGFPGFWRSDVPSTMKELTGLRVWEIQSSIGFDGWVVARTVSEADQDAVGNE